MEEEGVPPSTPRRTDQKHCSTCQCATLKIKPLHTPISPIAPAPLAVSPPSEEETRPLPPPLPAPKVTFRRRVLPETLVALQVPAGQLGLQRSLQQGTAATYFALSSHWDNQSDPASCGVTTLRQVLNATGLDPTAVRWKGGWRYYGSDAMVLCACMDPIRVEREGITMEDFRRLTHCHGLQVTVHRPTDEKMASLDDFRRDVLASLTTTSPGKDCVEAPNSDVVDDVVKNDSDMTEPATLRFLVVSFARGTLGQTGDGHFSTVAAYDAQTDSCLILDVARFKYPPYWAPLVDLYAAMEPVDPVTGQARGWLTVWRSEQPNYLDEHGLVKDEGSLPATWVPAFDQTTDATCPLRPLQVQYCPTAWQRRRNAK